MVLEPIEGAGFKLGKMISPLSGIFWHTIKPGTREHGTMEQRDTPEHCRNNSTSENTSETSRNTNGTPKLHSRTPMSNETIRNKEQLQCFFKEISTSF